MPSDSELDKTVERSERVSALWEEIEGKLADFERDKEEFAREFGLEFEDYVKKVASKAKDTRDNATPEMLEQIEAKKRELEQQFDEELARAKAQHESEKTSDSTSGAKRVRRMRNMI